MHSDNKPNGKRIEKNKPGYIEVEEEIKQTMARNQQGKPAIQNQKYQQSKTKSTRRYLKI